MSVTYRDAGVDLTVADEVAATLRARLQTGLFGGFLPVPQLKEYDLPVLVSSIDGVGTKVHLAAQLDRVEGLGQDLVHHCVNDIAVHGAEPLLFLDYLAFHRVDPALVDRIVTSIAGACSALGITLAGGETAEMPLVYPEGRFDLAGAIVGAVDQARIIDGSAIRPGDVLLGLPSSGLHTNGYSLVQHLFYEDEYNRYERALGTTLGEALLTPHRCYLREIRCLSATGAVHGLAHITGGGIEGNLNRIIPDDLTARITPSEPPPLFRYLAATGIDTAEMRSVFNMGIGLIAVCDPSILRQISCYPVIGRVDASEIGDRRVIWE
jgi:phosphoribosylformylglycinamidine cyclo-ligase